MLNRSWMGFFVNVQKPSQLQNLRRVPGGGRQARWQINRELVVLFEPGVQELKKITSRCALCWRPVSIQAKAAMLPFGPTRSFCRIIAYVGCLRTSGLDLLAARLSESDPQETSGNRSLALRIRTAPDVRRLIHSSLSRRLAALPPTRRVPGLGSNPIAFTQLVTGGRDRARQLVQRHGAARRLIALPVGVVR
jgi:hypothetical protein